MTAMNMDEQTHLLDIGVVQVDVLRVDRCERLNVLLVADVRTLFISAITPNTLTNSRTEEDGRHFHPLP